VKFSHGVTSIACYAVSCVSCGKGLSVALCDSIKTSEDRITKSSCSVSSVKDHSFCMLTYISWIQMQVNCLLKRIERK